MARPRARLAVLAGGGRVPVLLAEAAATQGRLAVVIGFEGNADPAPFARFPFQAVRIGAAGRLFEILRSHGAEEIVLAGTVRRPAVSALMPDLAGMKVLARLGRAMLGGDDTLLSAVIREFEAEGFRVVGAHDVLADLLTPSGQLGRVAANEAARTDIARGVAVLRAMGAVDVGQAVVVQQGLVLGVEAIEGTDALLARVATLARDGQGGVLVKLAKPQQEKRVDLPTIGLATVQGAAGAGLVGIAAEAGRSLFLDRAETIAAADAAGLFLLGIDTMSDDPAAAPAAP